MRPRIFRTFITNILQDTISLQLQWEGRKSIVYQQSTNWYPLTFIPFLPFLFILLPPHPCHKWQSRQPREDSAGARRKGEYWNCRWNSGAIGALGSNVGKDSPDEPKWTHQKLAEIIAEEKTPVEAMIKEESAGVTRATGGKAGRWDRRQSSIYKIFT